MDQSLLAYHRHVAAVAVGVQRPGEPCEQAFGDIACAGRVVLEQHDGRLRMKRPGGVPAADASSPSAGARRDTTQTDCFAAACGTFNESAFRRTVSGIAKSLGDPSANLVYLTGAKPEVVITVAWDLSWHQYRVVIAETPSIRLVERGYEIDELEARFRVANASFDSEMSLAPFEDAVAAGDSTALSH